MDRGGKKNTTNNVWIMASVILLMVVLGTGIATLLDYVNLNADVDIYQAVQATEVGKGDSAEVTSRIMSSMMLYVSDQSLEEKTLNRAAVNGEDAFQESLLRMCFPEAQIITCASLADCMAAVAGDEADFTLAELSQVEALGAENYEGVQSIEFSGDITVSILTGENQQLASLLEEILPETVTEAAKEEIILETEEGNSFQRFVRKHVVGIIVAFVVIFYFAIGTVLVYFINKNKNKDKIEAAEKNAKDAYWRAEHDVMTGLLNRVAYDEVAEKLKSSERPIALLIFDVDHFKRINDTYGHSAGDRVLVKVGNLIYQSFRREDFVIRYAGDEFVVFMMNITEKQKEIIAGKIRKINEALQSTTELLSVSVGVAFSPRGYQVDLFNKADSALYRVKNEFGRCGYCVYEENE